MKRKDIQKLIEKIYNQVSKIKSGKVATYIPELAKADPNLFAITFVSCDGEVYEMGKTNTHIPIESISKVFTLSLAAEKKGVKKVVDLIGNAGSSLPFNSVVAAELSETHTINPFVNQGAIATTSLLYQKNITQFRKTVLGNLDAFAGRKLSFNKAVFNSEMKTNFKNMALAYLMKSYGRLYGKVDESVQVYTEQCSVSVNAIDLATMACVFAKGGIHPTTGKRICSKATSQYIIRSMRGEGLYEYSETWETDVGCIAAKSGVGGGILIVLKGIGGIGIVSPPLDKHGNSVKGIAAGKMLSNGIYKVNNARQGFCSETRKKLKKRSFKKRA